ncbi:TylF/MycF/NovP-related O-methyltransferase [Pseudoxanthomonas sp. UTMC 1351]|uniref:TylF/MycF/NovP-related O-methyltransferase n=1 Tax=Pseudoxanthomonas sp. UTMC 1351 TaxID=2695853 RepID=UPI0034CD550F
MHEIADVAPEGLQWEYLNRRITVTPKPSVLKLCVALARHVPGNIMEFGVANGDSTRILRRALGRSEKRIYACDSFEGLREKFENAEVGTFACKPPRIRGVEIVKGYFEDSLTPELAAKVGRVSFASLDADLYSSTLCALNWLTPLLGSGSLLLFDEFLGEKESEKRAFEDWSRESGLRTVRIAEFVREPSGWGTRIDKRPLFQVVGDDLLPKRPVSLRGRLRAGPLGGIARRARDLVFDRR